TTLEEARQFTTRLQYLQQEKKPTTNKNFSMTYHVYWDLCEQLNISHGESDFYQYLNAHCQRDQGNIVKMSLRRLAKKARIGRETLDRYLEKLAKIGWIIVKRIPKGGTISVTIQVTNAIREANEKRNVEQAERKANLKTMLKTGLATGPSDPSPSSSFAPSPTNPRVGSDHNPVSPSFFSPATGLTSDHTGPIVSPPDGPMASPQNKKIIQDSLKQKEIRSDQVPCSFVLEMESLNPKEQRMLALVHEYFPPLEEHYSHPKKLAEEQALERATVRMHAQHSMLAQEDEQLYVRLLCWIPSGLCEWYERYKKYPRAFLKIRLLDAKMIKQLLQEMGNWKPQTIIDEENRQYGEALQQHREALQQQTEKEEEDSLQNITDNSQICDVLSPIQPGELHYWQA